MLAKKASPAAAVLAVEPNSASRARLHTNLVWNGLHTLVDVAPYAVAGSLGSMALYVPMGADLLDTGASLERTPLVSRTELVVTAPIDVLLSLYGVSAPDLMKIDVEGLEEVALRGASRALANGPTLVLEIQSLDLFNRCGAILGEFGYRMYAVEDETLSLESTPAPEGSERWFAEHVRGRALNYLCVVRDEHLQLARQGVARVRALLDAG